MKAQHRAYLEKYHVWIEQWEAEIRNRKARAAGMAADLRVEYAKRTEGLERNVAAVRAHD